MAKLKFFKKWNAYDDNGKILEEGDTVRVSLDGEVVEGKIDILFAVYNEEIAYIEIVPVEEEELSDEDLNNDDYDDGLFYQLFDFYEFESMEKI